MILTNLTKEDIFKAATRIDQEGIPKDHVWNEYYAVVNNKEYPFKYIVHCALIAADSEESSFKSTPYYRNYIESLGFKITEYKKHGYNFFTQEELTFYASIAGRRYRVNDDKYQ